MITDQRDGGIQWCDFTVNPLRYRNAQGGTVWACAKVSPECARCYAETLAQRYGRGGPFNAGEVAKLTPYMDDGVLRSMATSRKISGHKVFVADMTDVGGDWVTDDMLAALFAVCAMRTDVTWQVLTKRPERLASHAAQWRANEPMGIRHAAAQSLRKVVSGQHAAEALSAAMRALEAWPLPNVWVGTSVGVQATTHRVSTLLDIPAAVRFVSYEPALERVGFGNMLAPLDWVIFGGESGAGARPCDADWARELLDRASLVGTAVFVKQFGDNTVSGAPVTWPGRGVTRGGSRVRLPHKGGDMESWPAWARVRQWPRNAPVAAVARG